MKNHMLRSLLCVCLLASMLLSGCVQLETPPEPTPSESVLDSTGASSETLDTQASASSGATQPPSQGAGKNAYAPYLFVIDDAIQESGFYSLSDEEKNDCFGCLYNIDGMPGQELILCFSSNSSYSYIVEIWKSDGDTAQCLCRFGDFEGIISPHSVRLEYIKQNGANRLMLKWGVAGSIAISDCTNIYSLPDMRLVYPTLIKMEESDNGQTSYHYLCGEKEIEKAEFDRMLSDFEHVDDLISLPSEQNPNQMLLPELRDFLENGGPGEETAAYFDVAAAAEKADEAVLSQYICDSARGVLFDMNDDGVQELLLVFNSLQPENPTFPQKVCSLYTYREGEVVTLLDQVCIDLYVGGSHGEAGFLKREGDIFFYTSQQNSENDAGVSNHYGEIKLYFLDAQELRLTHEVTFDIVSHGQEESERESKVYLDGTQLALEQYHSWLSENGYLYSLNLNDDEEGPETNGVLLKQLLLRLG